MLLLDLLRLRGASVFGPLPSRYLRDDDFASPRGGLDERERAFGSPWIIVASPSHPDLLPEFRKNLHARAGHSRSV